ncbi:nudC domain-containing protein 1 isoform X1 [Acipenser ruthenus]|uniref:nudC domain-containing protein 1 isoform X1 n=1 Tax=Acipenser ruthenus TaxID=7906 RepID=UPI0027412675|nr:nudC domain-containing protein 1 isoform X1 [Acipenser ruthenus]
MKMAASNYSLKVNKLLLDPKFESYRLSLDPLPIYNIELDAAVAEVKLRDDQYTLDHMRAFGMYNYLHCDPWYEDSVYYIDQLGSILNLTVTLDTALGKPREVFRLPSEFNTYENRLCASLHFTSSTWVALSDGTGKLYLMRTSKRGESAHGKWEILFNQDLGEPFIIINSLCYVNCGSHSIEVLLLRIKKDELDVKGSGFCVSIEWLTITNISGQDEEKKYAISKRRVLQGKSVPHYAAIEPEGGGLMIASDKPFRFTQVDGKQVEETFEETMDVDEKRENYCTAQNPIYYWQQTAEDITITVRLPEGTTKEAIEFKLSMDSMHVGLRGYAPLLEGQLYALVDTEASAWIMKEDKSLEITLLKKNDGPMWRELVMGNQRGEFIMDPAQADMINEGLRHLTSEDLNANPEQSKPPCNAQELEECDIFPEDSSSLTRLDGSTLKATHVVNLGSHQYLFSVVVNPAEMPCFCLRHDVDALLWQPHGNQQDNMWEHIATFNALGYVQASKRDKKFSTCSPNYSYAALCECLRRVFIYRQPSPVSTVLYNRKEGRQVGQVAKQQVASLESNDTVLGFRATNERLFVLTSKNLFVIKVNTGN